MKTYFISYAYKRPGNSTEIDNIILPLEKFKVREIESKIQQSNPNYFNIKVINLIEL